MKAWSRWQEGLALVLGAWLFATPWALAVPIGGVVAWTAWLLGAMVVVPVLRALAVPHQAAAELIAAPVAVTLFESR